MDDEEEELPMGQEAQLSELRSEITRQKKRIEELQKFESKNLEKIDQIDHLTEEIETQHALLREARENQQRKDDEIKKLREDMMNKIKQRSEGDMSDLITEELNRTKEDLYEKEQELRKLQNLEKQLSAKASEIIHLKDTLRLERDTQRELELTLEQQERNLQDADDKLRIVQESQTVNPDKDALVNERLRNKKLDKANFDLQENVEALTEDLKEIKRSKISLVQNAANEIERLRGALGEVSRGETQFISPLHTLAVG